MSAGIIDLSGVSLVHPNEPVHYLEADRGQSIIQPKRTIKSMAGLVVELVRLGSKSRS